MTMSEKRTYSLFPKTLDQCIEPLTRPIFKTQGLAGSRIVSDWASIVGPGLAAHTMPEKISFPKGQKTGGTLVISTENGFATELQHMSPQILERLASYFGYTAISRITISHTWVATPETEPPRPPLPTLPKDSARLADSIGDDALREALQSLARTLSGQP